MPRVACSVWKGTMGVDTVGNVSGCDGHTDGVDAFLVAARSIVGDRHVLTDPGTTASYETDWTGGFVGRTPAVVRPASTVEVAEIVTAARSAGVALVPQGGNTGLVGGSVPLAGEVVVSTTRLTGVEVDAEAGQVTAGAGASIADVQRAAAAAGWRYGVDFAARESATVGGSVATNAGGLRVVRHGMTRRQVVGIEAVLGTGDVVSHLGGLVKDNTGYDLAGLLCGSEGTLGIVTRVRLALVPAAGPTCTAALGFADVASAVRAVSLLRRRVPTLEAAELVLSDGVRLLAEQLGVVSPVTGDAAAVVVVEAVGPPDPLDDLVAALDDLDVVDAAVAEDPSRARALWAVRERHTEAIARLGVPLKFDVTLPQRRLAAFVEEIGAVVSTRTPGATSWVFGHVADGNLHVNVTDASAHADEVADTVLGRVVADGGSVSAEHGIGTAKRRWLEPGRSPAEVSAMRAIKAALDPDGICNPNVLL